MDGEPGGRDARPLREFLGGEVPFDASDRTALEPLVPGGGSLPDGVPDVDAAREALRRAADRIARGGDESNRDGSGATLAESYEACLSSEERRMLGGFYTPRSIADAIVRWAVRDGDGGRPARVLDPAAGGGAFLVAAYGRLSDRHPDEAHGSIVGRLAAVDVDPGSLSVAALALSRRAPGAPTALPAHHGSFFDLDPDDVGRFDAVVGNPPFIRAENLSPDADHFRDHLVAFGPTGATPYLDGGKRLDRRSDAYVYFVTHATRFLREGGRLGVVLPSKWLASAYGEAFQRFLLDHYAIRGIVGFDARTFDDALVDTVLLLAERRGDPGARDGPVRFLRAAEPSSVDDALSTLSEPVDVPAGAVAVRAGDRVRTVARREDDLAPGKLSPYLAAPEPLLDLLDHPGLASLSGLAAVSRGVTTGANRFFFVTPDEADDRGIDDRFLRPALKSVRGIETRALGPADVERYLVDVHAYVERVAAGDGDGTREERDRPGEEGRGTLEGRVKRTLARDGYDGLAGYVRHAEAEGWHEGRTCRSRAVWFDLGDLPVPDVFVPKLLRERVFVVRNDAGAVPSNAIDCLTARDGVDAAALAGVLDSSLVRAVMEVWGRDEAGMLQLMTYETGTLPVPDVRRFDAAERARIRRAADALVDGADGGREALDAAVLDALDVGLPGERLRRIRERLLRRRVDGDAPTEY